MTHERKPIDLSPEGIERLADKLAADADANDAARYQPYTDGRMRDAAAALRALSARAAELEAARNGWMEAHGRKGDDLAAEAAARQRAEAERDALRETLEACAMLFREYEGHHLAKSPPDTAKAERNGAMARLIDLVLATAGQT